MTTRLPGRTPDSFNFPALGFYRFHSPPGLPVALVRCGPQQVLAVNGSPPFQPDPYGSSVQLSTNLPREFIATIDVGDGGYLDATVDGTVSFVPRGFSVQPRHPVPGGMVGEGEEISAAVPPPVLVGGVDPDQAVTFLPVAPFNKAVQWGSALVVRPHDTVQIFDQPVAVDVGLSTGILDVARFRSLSLMVSMDPGDDRTIYEDVVRDDGSVLTDSYGRDIPGGANWFRHYSSFLTAPNENVGCVRRRQFRLGPGAASRVTIYGTP